MLFRLPPDRQQHGGIGHVLPSQVDADALAHGPAVGQRVFQRLWSRHGTTVFISAGNRSRLVWRFLSAQSAQSALAKPICFMRLSSPLAIAYAIVGGPDKSVRPWGTA